jgi:16S rRNA (guanine527-N7)-methyltransferase
MSQHVPTAPSADTIRRALADFKITLGDLQVEQIQQYMRLLLAWNDKVNLTAIRDPLEILYRHFCESMYAGTAVPLEHGRLADIGSGGGFPGLPLKILRPQLDVTLVESNAKKGTFIAEVIRDIELSGARVLVSRYEELAEELTPLDFVCSRAVGDFEPFLGWAASGHVAAPRAILWIGSSDLERVVKISGWSWLEPIRVPQSLRRLIIVGSRKAEEEQRDTPQAN